jgi:hypothetical protein
VTSVSAPAHNHIPSAAVLNEVARIFDDHQIKVHFDVGPDLGALYARDDNSCESIRPGHHQCSRRRDHSGNSCVMRSLNLSVSSVSGTVGWMRGFKYYAQAPVGPNGEELTPAQQDAQSAACLSPAHSELPRPIRWRPHRDLSSHLYAHARAKPKSLPCLDSDGDAIPFDDAGDCTEDENPAFNPINYHVPSSTSGIAHLPGSSVLIALGGWDTTNSWARPSCRYRRLCTSWGTTSASTMEARRPSGATPTTRNVLRAAVQAEPPERDELSVSVARAA